MSIVLLVGGLAIVVVGVDADAGAPDQSGSYGWATIARAASIAAPKSASGYVHAGPS